MRYLLLMLLVLCGYAADDRRPLVKTPTGTGEFPNGDTLRVAPRQGLDASKGTASSYAKCIYVATDTLKVYYSDGSNWVEISPAQTAFADNAFVIYDDGDNTKQLITTLGNQTTATTVTLNTGAQTANRQVSLPVMTADGLFGVFAATPTATHIPYVGGNSQLTNDAAFLHNSDNSLTIGKVRTGEWSVNSSYAFWQNSTLGVAAGNYGVLQSGTGETYVNGAAGTTNSLRVNNSSIMSWDANGTVCAQEAAALKFQVNGSTGTYPWEIQASGGADEFYIRSNTAGTNRLTLDASGNMTVGGTLSAFGTNAQGSGIRLGDYANIFQADGTASATDVRLGIRPASSTTVAGLQFSLFSTSNALIDANTFTAGGAYSAAKNLVLNGQSTGEVLVGTTTDAGSQRLQVNGGVLGSYYDVRPIGGSVSSQWQFGSDATSDGMFFYDTTASAYRMVINDGGETLLGTTTDVGAYRLQVNGNAYTSGIINSDGIIVGPAASTSTATFRAPHGTAPSSPTNGDIWTTTAGLYVRINGATVGPLSAGGSGSSAFKFSGRTSMFAGASSTSEVSFLPTTFTGSATFGANTLTQGSIVRIRGTGYFSTNGTPTVRIRIKFGSTVVSGTNSTVTTTSTASTDVPFSFQTDCTIWTTGALAQVRATGSMAYNTTSTTQTFFEFVTNGGGGSDPVNIDTTASQTVDTTVQFGTSDAQNEVTIKSLSIEHILP